MKTLIGFIAGIVLAGGIAFFVVQRKTEPVAQPAAAVTPQVSEIPSAPPPQVVDESKPAAPAAPEPAARPVEKRRAAPAASKQVPKAAAPSPAPEPAPAQQQKPAETAVAQNDQPPAPAPEPPPYRESAPPPPPKPATVTIQSGTAIYVRLQEALASDKNQTGDAFSAVLDRPLVVDGFVIAERGARVEGKVVASKAAGRVKGTSDIAIELSTLHTSDGQTVKIVTEPWEKHGDTTVKSDAAKVGAAAGLGAIIGAIAGGGKGAAIGAAVGGGAGTGGVLATRGKPVKIPVETKIPFMLKESVTLTERLH